jgi:hypothetical protein
MTSSQFNQLVLLDPPEEMKTSIIAFTLRIPDRELLITLQDALRLDLFTSVTYPLPSYLEEKWGRGEFVRLSPGPDLNEQDLNMLGEVFSKILL